jgi:hypothetical protein
MWEANESPSLKAICKLQLGGPVSLQVYSEAQGLAAYLVRTKVPSVKKRYVQVTDYLMGGVWMPNTGSDSKVP